MSTMGKSLSYKMYSLHLWFFLRNQYLNTAHIYAFWQDFVDNDENNDDDNSEDRLR